MRVYTMTLSYRGDKGQRGYWEQVSRVLQREGGRLVNITARAGKAGYPPTPFNILTITYQAPSPIELNI